MRLALPIDGSLPQVEESLRKFSTLIIQASPGSGKTTRVPPYLLSASWRRPDQEILVLEPRRLAAKLSALRVAEERGEKIGQTVGYRFRLESQGSGQTRLWYLTEGMLMRRLLLDPALEKVGLILLDEFHERHLHTDLALAYLRHLQLTRRPDLRIVLMSATLDAQKISAHLGGCPILTVESRLYPVSVDYLPVPPSKKLDQLVTEAVRKSLGRKGDMLVFLPGMGDIRRAESALQSIREVKVFPLHGDLSREEQEGALAPSSTSKVILSTNIAETSLTIPGITTVIDSGLHRQASYSWWSGVPTLKTRSICKASAEQRMGRAGRVEAGHCLRLYTKHDFDTRPAFDLPELQRADLTQTLLELLSLGVEDTKILPWLEPPPPASVEASYQLLQALGAMKSGKLTRIGEKIARIPAHPRLARMLLAADEAGVVGEAATLVALISEGELDMLDALSATAPPWLERARRHLLSEFSHSSMKKDRTLLARAVLTGFPDRVARRRTQSSRRVKLHESEVVLATGGSAILPDGPVVQESDWYVALDVQESQGRMNLRAVVPIHPDWLWELEPSPLEEKKELYWNPEKKKVNARETLRLGQLILEEKELPVDGEEATQILLRQGLGIKEELSKLKLTDWIEALRPVCDPESLEQIFSRLSLVLDEERVRQSIVDSLGGVTSLEELRKRDWVNSFPQWPAHKLDALLPETIQLPSGRSAKVFYRLGKTPWLESRLQDFFGMARGPSILNGKLPLTLHLLAPNQRAVQVTTDLAGFWERSYPAIRKELGRKYPRHSWPENPLVKPPPRVNDKRRG